MNYDEYENGDDYPRVDPNFAKNLQYEIGWVIDETTPSISERKSSNIKIGPLISNHVSDKFIELGKMAVPTLFASVGNVWTSRGFCEAMGDALKMPNSLKAIKSCLQNKCWKYIKIRDVDREEISHVLYFHSEYDKRVIAILQSRKNAEECCAWFYLEECLRKDDPLFISF